MTKAKRWAVTEVLTIFGLVMMNIWFFQKQAIPFIFGVIAIAGVVGVSSATRISGIKRRIPKDINPALRNALIAEGIGNYTWEIGIGRWRKSFRFGWYIEYWDFSWAWRLACLTALGLVLILIAGYFLKPEFWLEKKFWRRMTFGVQGYIVWGAIQQFLLHACVTSRIYSIFASDADPLKVEKKAVWLTVLVSGLLFLFVHMPNPKLMIITPIAGAATAYIFLNCRNILMLGVAHGILGTAIEYCLPLSINVGPYFWQKPG